MTEENSTNNESICTALQRLTGWVWKFKHDKLHPRLDGFVSTLQTEEAAKLFQNKLVDHQIHFSRYPESGVGHPSLTFELRPEEAIKFCENQTPSLVVEPRATAIMVADDRAIKR